MELLEMTSITLVFMNQLCEIPDVVDVSPADRFGEPVIVISIPTGAEHDKVKSLLPANDHKYGMHIMPLFGLGSFTGNSTETREVLSLVNVSPYNVYGTPEHGKLEERMKDVEAREAEIWASMESEARRAAIEKEIERRRAAGRSEFGNCWSKQTRASSKTAH